MPSSTLILKLRKLEISTLALGQVPWPAIKVILITTGGSSLRGLPSKT